MSYCHKGVIIMAKQGINPYKGRAIPKSAIEGAINKTMSMRAAAMEMNVAYTPSRSTVNYMICGTRTNQALVFLKDGLNVGLI